MIPTFLWSTLVIQARQPVVGFARVNTPSVLAPLGDSPEGSASWPSASAMTMLRVGSLQDLQVGDELIDLLF